MNKQGTCSGCQRVVSAIE